jgi:hypothetical protein
MSIQDTAKGGQAVETMRWKLTDEEKAEALNLLTELFGIDTTDDPDPLIDIPMIAELAGVAPGTPDAWRQRTRSGMERIPFPEPGDHRYKDKPQWYAITQVIQGFLLPSGRWPRGHIGRAGTRVSDADRLDYAQLALADQELALEIARFGAIDGKRRSLQGWRGWRTRAKRATQAAA